MSMQYFNSIEVAKLLGVNVSSVKRWTDDGKLTCVKTAGGHRKFMLNHIADFLEKNKKKTSKANLFPIEDSEDIQVSYFIMKNDYTFLRDYLYKQAIACRRDKVQQVFNGLYLGQNALHTIYDHLITPVLHRIGSNWEQGKISVTEEHFSTQTIRDAITRLQGIINIPKKKIGKAICMNLSSELHDIALKMVDYILEEQGYHVYYSGQLTPYLEIEKSFETIHPDRLYISSTIVLDRKSLQDEFDQITELAKNFNTNIYVGGKGFNLLEIPGNDYIFKLASFEEVFETSKPDFE